MCSVKLHTLLLFYVEFILVKSKCCKKTCRKGRWRVKREKRENRRATERERKKNMARKKGEKRKTARHRKKKTKNA